MSGVKGCAPFGREMHPKKRTPGDQRPYDLAGGENTLSRNSKEEERNVETYFLLKTEPTEYSFADLQKDGETEWDGVSNPVAVRHLSEMKPGARLVIYETGERKTAVGTATVVSVTAKDPKKPIVEIRAGKALAKPVSLAEIKQNKIFKDSPLVRMGRLSVVPLTKEQYGALVGG